MTETKHTPINYEAMDNPETFVPHHMRGGYQRFFEHGISPGSFGQAILDGDAERARARADHININHIESQIAWVRIARYQRATGSGQ